MPSPADSRRVPRYNQGVPGLSLGDVVGGCRIESVAGRGGMGVVYRAVQVRLDRPVAVKVISPAFAADSVYRGRFQREARLTASIEHANVLPVYEAGELDNDELYLVMRWVAGTDLRHLLAREDRLAPGRAVELLAPVARGLDAAHARGLVHRDVKPANVLIASGEDPSTARVYLTDFGIARGPGEDGGLTTAGAFLGTLAYAAPERIDGHRAGPAADIYALGCVVFEALTGFLPFNRESELATMNAHLSDPIPMARSQIPDMPAELDDVIHIALAKDPAQRFASAAAMATALENAVIGRSIRNTITSGPQQPPPETQPSARLDTTAKTPRDPVHGPSEPAGRRAGLLR
jgi:serine/threonine protein kinase